MTEFRIGTGAGFSADRLDPAVDLVTRGDLDTIVFECVGERTLAFGHRDRAQDPSTGYNPWLERRLTAVLPACIANNTRLITNMGVANPEAAARRAVDVAKSLGLKGIKVAALTGDDVTHAITMDTPLWEGSTVGEVGRRLLGANAYLGAEDLLPALDDDAQVVITGRVADPALFVAPMAHHFGWALDDWPQIGAGTVVGHLLECAGQITGGYFADPGHKDVSGLTHLGFPLAEVTADGDAIITKLHGTGGLVSPLTVKEQLLYEVHDPSCYLTPDVSADFSRVRIEPAGQDRVRVSGGGGRERPEQLKVTVAFDGGFLAEAGISYAGLGAGDRARLAGEILRARMVAVHDHQAPVRIDLIGLSSLHATAVSYADDGMDVRLRCATRASTRESAQLLLWEVESLLCCGPAGGGGYRGQVTPSVMTYSASIHRAAVESRVQYWTV